MKEKFFCRIKISTLGDYIQQMHCRYSKVEENLECCNVCSTQELDNKIKQDTVDVEVLKYKTII